jgi:cytosine/adenosine deaminase-related metal-dependent hydrolase
MMGTEFKDGELIVENGSIMSVGSAGSDFFDGEVLDLTGYLVMPGFINAHCHLSLSALFNKVDKIEIFSDWVLALLEQDEAMNDGQRIKAIHQEANSLVDSGVTTLADYLGRPNLLDEYEKLPFRQIVFLEAIGFQKSKAETIIENLRAIFKANKSNSLLKLGLAPHAPYSVSPELFHELRDLADEMNCPISSHIAELEEEDLFLKDGTGSLRELLDKREAYDADWEPPGISALQYLEDLDVLDSMIGVHLNHIGRDKSILVGNFMTAVFCPGSTKWFNRSKYLDIKSFLNGSIAVGLGTDSLASNESFNFFRELRLTEEMQPGLSRQEILEVATRRGADALGLKTGVLGRGMPADIIAMKINGQLNSPYDIPFEPDRNKVDFSMINGKIVVEKR